MDFGGDMVTVAAGAPGNQYPGLLYPSPKPWGSLTGKRTSVGMPEAFLKPPPRAQTHEQVGSMPALGGAWRSPGSFGWGCPGSCPCQLLASNPPTSQGNNTNTIPAIVTCAQSPRFAWETAHLLSPHLGSGAWACAPWSLLPPASGQPPAPASSCVPLLASCKGCCL